MINVDYAETIDRWSTKDAVMVLNGEHARGRQAEIRLKMIKNNCRLSKAEQRELYTEYCNQLVRKIAAVDGGNSYGTMPSFE